MPLHVDKGLTPADLLPAIGRMWELSADRIRAIDVDWPPERGAPVITAAGKYTSREWTEWTQGFEFGSALLQFDATGEVEFLELGRGRTLSSMAPHVTNFGVHDHGFNVVSTYGALWRLAREGRFAPDGHELALYELALKISGAVQARRWTATSDGGGFIYSFNGPHSLFIDTMRSLRSLALAHLLGHRLVDEHGSGVPLVRRLIDHARTTARYAVYYGERRDAYDIYGRVAHESLFNPSSGAYRCPSTQQGYSPFTTWTRGLAWSMLGFAELMEFLNTVRDEDIGLSDDDRCMFEKRTLRAARSTADFYIDNMPADGVPYWDTGAPGLATMGDYLDRPADPFNDREPVDSSAAAIAAQGLWRVGGWLTAEGDETGRDYQSAGLTIARTLLAPPYLCEQTAAEHQGLLLHTVYHRPNGWDYVPPGSAIPRGESGMWGDYHLRELAHTIQREARGEAPYRFFGPSDSQ